MKQVIIILAILFTGVLYSQTVRIVNNNPGAPTGQYVYNNLQTCVDAADSGDIIQIVPSVTSYGDVTIKKKLTLYGVGWNPDKELSVKSTVSNIYLEKKATLPELPISDASGSKISGLVTGTIYFNSYMSTGLNNIIIEKNAVNYIFTGAVQGPHSNIIISNNYIGHSGIGGSYGGPNGVGVFFGINVLICNNIFIGSSSWLINIQGGSFIVRNNLIIYGKILSNGGNQISNNVIINKYENQSSAFEFTSGNLISNNIFYRCSPFLGGNSTGNTMNNNISYGSTNDTIPTGNNSGANNLRTNPLFVNVPTLGITTWDKSYDFHLQLNSPGKNAGTDGTDIGLYGGAYPFNFSQTGSTLPVVQSVVSPGTVVKGQPFNVKIKARGY